MSKGRAAFKQRDVTRAMRAASAAGFSVDRVEIDRDGKVVLVTRAASDNSIPLPKKGNGWDDA